MNSGMVIARVTASTKRRRRGTHQMYRAAPEDSLKAAESSLRLHRRRSPATIVVGGLLSILLPTLVALPAAVYRVAERLRNPDDRRRSPRGASAGNVRYAAIRTQRGNECERSRRGPRRSPRTFGRRGSRRRHGKWPAQTEAAAVGGPRDATTIEALEDPGDLVGRDTGACV